MTEYQKELEKLRIHYKDKHGVNLDDEFLYFIMRVNEQQRDLKKHISTIPKITFPTKWDYYMYGLGKWLVPSIIVSLVLTLVISLYSRSTRAPLPSKIIIIKEKPYLEIVNNKGTYLLPLESVK